MFTHRIAGFRSEARRLCVRPLLDKVNGIVIFPKRTASVILVVQEDPPPPGPYGDGLKRSNEYMRGRILPCGTVDSKKLARRHDRFFWHAL